MRLLINLWIVAIVWAAWLVMILACTALAAGELTWRAWTGSEQDELMHACIGIGLALTAGAGLAMMLYGSGMP